MVAGSRPSWDACCFERKVEFMRCALVTALILVSASVAGPAMGQPFLAQGERVGEVTATTAIVWTRLTLREKPNPGVAHTKRPPLREVNTTPWSPDLPEGVPGAPGRVRIHYALRPDFVDGQTTTWRQVDEKTNFATQFALSELKPATVYYYRAVRTCGFVTSPRKRAAGSAA